MLHSYIYFVQQQKNLVSQQSTTSIKYNLMYSNISRDKSTDERLNNIFGCINLYIGKIKSDVGVSVDQ